MLLDERWPKVGEEARAKSSRLLLEDPSQVFGRQKSACGREMEVVQGDMERRPEDGGCGEDDDERVEPRELLTNRVRYVTTSASGNARRGSNRHQALAVS